jgi:cobalt-precorrin-5B (C1)-methyltransferase
MEQAGYPSFFERLSQLASRRGWEHAGGGITVETVLVTMKGALLGRAVWT